MRNIVTIELERDETPQEAQVRGRAAHPDSAIRVTRPKARMSKREKTYDARNRGVFPGFSSGVDALIAAHAAQARGDGDYSGFLQAIRANTSVVRKARRPTRKGVKLSDVPDGTSDHCSIKDFLAIGKKLQKNLRGYDPTSRSWIASIEAVVVSNRELNINALPSSSHVSQEHELAPWVTHERAERDTRQVHMVSAPTERVDMISDISRIAYAGSTGAKALADALRLGRRDVETLPAGERNRIVSALVENTGMQSRLTRLVKGWLYYFWTVAAGPRRVELDMVATTQIGAYSTELLAAYCGGDEHAFVWDGSEGDAQYELFLGLIAQEYPFVRGDDEEYAFRGALAQIPADADQILVVSKIEPGRHAMVGRLDLDSTTIFRYMSMYSRSIAQSEVSELAYSIAATMCYSDLLPNITLPHNVSGSEIFKCLTADSAMVEAIPSLGLEKAALISGWAHASTCAGVWQELIGHENTLASRSAVRRDELMSSLHSIGGRDIWYSYINKELSGGGGILRAIDSLHAASNRVTHRLYERLYTLCVKMHGSDFYLAGGFQEALRDGIWLEREKLDALNLSTRARVVGSYQALQATPIARGLKPRPKVGNVRFYDSAYHEHTRYLQHGSIDIQVVGMESGAAPDHPPEVRFRRIIKPPEVLSNVVDDYLAPPVRLKRPEPEPQEEEEYDEYLGEEGTLYTPPKVVDRSGIPAMFFADDSEEEEEEKQPSRRVTRSEEDFSALSMSELAERAAEQEKRNLEERKRKMDESSSKRQQALHRMAQTKEAISADGQLARSFLNTVKSQNRSGSMARTYDEQWWRVAFDVLQDASHEHCHTKYGTSSLILMNRLEDGLGRDRKTWLRCGQCGSMLERLMVANNNSILCKVVQSLLHRPTGGRIKSFARWLSKDILRVRKLYSDVIVIGKADWDALGQREKRRLPSVHTWMVSTNYDAKYKQTRVGTHERGSLQETIDDVATPGFRFVVTPSREDCIVADETSASGAIVLQYLQAGDERPRVPIEFPPN
jgi:hypothetical protein